MVAGVAFAFAAMFTLGFLLGSAATRFVMIYRALVIADEQSGARFRDYPVRKH